MLLQVLDGHKLACGDMMVEIFKLQKFADGPLWKQKGWLCKIPENAAGTAMS